MTLKEIEKIIDEADFCLKKKKDEKYHYGLDAEEGKHVMKHLLDRDLENGYVFIFFKLNDNGFVTKRWFIDHFDKEKKIIKKKLGDMTDDEIKHIEQEFCGNDSCDKCPLQVNKLYWCGASFPHFRKDYFNYKDIEIEINTEE